MPLAIPNTTLTTDYDDAAFSGGDIFESGFFTIANGTAAVQMFAGKLGQAKPYAEMFLPPGTYPLRSGRRDPVAGIRFKSFIDPVPSPAPQVFGTLFYPGDAVIEAGSPFDAIVDAAGGIVGVTDLLGRVDGAGVILAGTGFTVVRIGAGQYTVTYDTAFPSVPVVLANAIMGQGADTGLFLLTSTVNAFGIQIIRTAGFQDNPFNFAVFAV